MAGKLAAGVVRADPGKTFDAWDPPRSIPAPTQSALRTLAPEPSFEH